MPVRSEAQRRMLNARFGHEWVKEHHFDNKGNLPARASRRKKRSSAVDNRREQMVRQFLRKHSGKPKR